MLLSSRADLQREVGASRSAGPPPDAEAESLRRLERDIHDGPQQRLVRLSMDLGRATTSSTRPAAGRGDARRRAAQARETVDELRSLSRGIAPPLLVDRGLVAALRWPRAAVPVDAPIDVPGPAPHVETAAYFMVAEALTNVAKHSGAAASR